MHSEPTIGDLLIGPIVHLNGTTRERLMEQYLNALQALREALAALQETGPNGRDYYPNPDPDALAKALRQHRQRMLALELVMAELNHHAERL